MRFSLLERYLLYRLLRLTLFSLFCFSALYALIDYSTHAKHFHQREVSGLASCLYYAWQLIRYGEILLPLGLLMATSRILATLRTQQTLVGLLGNGVPLWRILRPFLCFGVGGLLLLVFNAEYLQPVARKEIAAFESTYFHHNRTEKSHRVHSLHLKDGSTLVYQLYNPIERELVDVYWIKSFDEIYRIHSLSLKSTPPLAKRVEHLVRAPSQEIFLKARLSTLSLPELPSLDEVLYAPQWAAPSELFSWIRLKISGHHRLSLLTLLLYKWLAPFTALLAVLLPIPFIFRFERSFSSFVLYTTTLILLMGFFTALRTGVTLSDHQLFSPFVALLLPAFVACLLIGRSAWRVCR